MSIPRWMEPLLEAGETKELDRWAMTEKGVPGEELMERAGEGLAGVVARRAPAGRIAIVCGKGNNGADGIVAPRPLRAAGPDGEVPLLWPPGGEGGGAWGRGGGGGGGRGANSGARPPQSRWPSRPAGCTART